MRRVLHSLAWSFGDQSTEGFRRVFLCLLLGISGGLFLLARLQPMLRATPEQMIAYTLGAGFLAMLAASLLEVSSALWQKGFVAKCVAGCLFSVGTVTAIMLVSFAAAVALGG